MPAPSPVPAVAKPKELVCLKYVESFRPGDVIKRDQLPAAADLEFLIGTGAIREATLTETGKEKVDITSASAQQTANKLLEAMETELNYQKRRNAALEAEMTSHKLASKPVVDLEKVLAARDGEIATLKTQLATIRTEHQALKDSSQPK